jgi:hypothetical protein
MSNAERLARMVSGQPTKNASAADYRSGRALAKA